MSNTEKNPAEVLCENELGTGVQLLSPREVPLGGPRAMNVRRTLPQRSRSLIGGWCFVDHYGPETTRMHVPPHPHTGLQTVSWLFAGDIEHSDSVGSLATVRPGELNLMTAGRGISHSEVSPAEPTLLHGAQLWVALPNAHRDTAPAFENFVPTPFEHQGATVSVFIGELAGVSSPARVFSPLLGAQLDVPADTSITLTLDATFEHGVLVDAGDVTIADVETPEDHLAYLAPGLTELSITAATDTRLLLLGGEPLGEAIIMWWNFIGRSHDEIVMFRAQWQADVIEAGNPSGRFGTVASCDGHPLPAPELPTIRLRPRL
ncbi:MULTISPECIES: pirin family protein [unclassified Salinibacterium]|uniref:pirin family protein n=1 Tax=unclassified Salinibacterium TaxID=2632331 RepID=UPI0018CEEB56|nr:MULTISPECIES: pirin family protein [unclassified Salinibacterium]MBH0053161.1 pirin family protein [Salinibacterium sp. SWN139]MBH0082427.1 pirin family protein [Salinibacterium sp. SWN167]